MRTDAAELYQRWWPVALRYATRWAPSEADAEDIAAAAIIAFIEEAPAGLSDGAIERALSRTISRSRNEQRLVRRSGHLMAEGSEEGAGADGDAATWERVRQSLDEAELALFERAVPGTTAASSGPASQSAVVSRRFRARKRAAAAAMSVDGLSAGPTCARYVALIPKVARRTATNAQRVSLLEHIQTCDYCDATLQDRRSVAQRWKIAGALPGFGALRKWGWRLWGPGAAHPVLATGAAATVGAVIAAAVIVPLLAFPSGTTTAAVDHSRHTNPGSAPHSSTTSPSTTTTTAPTSQATATTSPAESPTTIPETPTTTPPVQWNLRAQALTQPVANGVVPVNLFAAATRDGAPDAGDTLTFSSACETVQTVTGSTGTASARMTCPPSAFPLVVTVTNASGVATQVDVDQA